MGIKKFGIDISEHNKEIDFAKLKNEVDFVIIRVGYGDMLNGGVDPYFKQNIEGCIKHNIPYGFYMANYIWNDERAKIEAKAMLEIIKPYKPTYPIYFDFENFSVDYAKQMGVTVTKDMATRWANIWCKIIEDAGYYVGIYTNPDYMSRYFDGSLFAKYDLWLAHWSNKPMVETRMWQYTNDVKLSGASNGIARADGNYCFYDYPGVIKSNGLNNHGKTPQVKPQDKPQQKPSTSYPVGTSVKYNGYVYADSYGGGKGAKVSGTFKVTIRNNNPYGVHIDNLGWVSPSDLSNTSTPRALKVGDKVKYNGNVHVDSYGGGQGAVVNGIFKVTIINGNPYGVHLDNLGWVKSTHVKLV